jgi:branched-chain amino acid transport system permease protein
MVASADSSTRTITHRLFRTAQICLAVGVAWLLLKYPEYIQSQLAFVAVYAIAGLGMHVIVGQCGQISLGHAALMGLGAYASAVSFRWGLPWLPGLFLAMLLGALGGFLAALPAVRLGGLYFGMATLAFGLLIEEWLIWAQPLTGGNAGWLVAPASLGGVSLISPFAQWGVSMLALGLCFLWVRHIDQSRLGRAFRAVRDDEMAAAACGISVLATKIHAFALGGALAGLAGALYAQLIGYLTPTQFGMHLSFEMLILVFLGGMRRPLGVLWGATLLIALPQAIVLLRDAVPMIEASAGLETVLFGAFIVLVVLWFIKKEAKQ